jgi:lysozyme
MDGKKLMAWDEMENRVAEHEGFSSVPYLCPAGRVSIGYGTNLEANPHYLADIEDVDAGNIMMRVAAGELRGQALLEEIQGRMEWTRAWARAVMEDHLRDLSNQIDRRWPWIRLLDRRRYCVLVEMAYQLGVGGLAGFRRMFRALDQNNYNRAAAEMLDSGWHRRELLRLKRNPHDGIPTRAERLAKIMRGGDDA